MRKKVIVIGGGLGGLSAAMRLAADGHEVTVLEKKRTCRGQAEHPIRCRLLLRYRTVYFDNALGTGTAV